MAVRRDSYCGGANVSMIVFLEPMGAGVAYALLCTAFFRDVAQLQQTLWSELHKFILEIRWGKS